AEIAPPAAPGSLWPDWPGHWTGAGTDSSKLPVEHIATVARLQNASRRAMSERARAGRGRDTPRLTGSRRPTYGDHPCGSLARTTDDFRGRPGAQAARERGPASSSAAAGADRGDSPRRGRRAARPHPATADGEDAGRRQLD